MIIHYVKYTSHAITGNDSTRLFLANVILHYTVSGYPLKLKNSGGKNDFRIKQ